MEFRTEVQRAGRITMPASVRKDFGIAQGDVVTWIVENGQIHLLPQQQALTEARALLHRYAPQGVESVASFLKQRRQEAAAEEREYQRDVRSEC